MPMMTSQILKSVDFTKTPNQKSKFVNYKSTATLLQKKVL